MRNPSSRVLRNRADIYVSTTTRGADGNPQFTHNQTPTFSAVPCTAQPKSVEVVDDQMRLTVLTSWTIIFGMPILVKPRDRLVIKDIDTGVTHAVYVQAVQNEAGRGMAYLVTATERE